ncbi:hypothetical protein BFN03_05155 [Rhodococcus sp. WMMA185]|uniref:hypothetical protein n=1 Tax=Rhodococcus sp. WMMA185 TaxID=679318 RepID=UPI00087860DC|nr:hypothetical protein [Rhodococcus sp. WMMA185]AOW92302.1 hypothetical protein BFN03_05155 [Rhodococcus sp. WMMA185]
MGEVLPGDLYLDVEAFGGLISTLDTAATEMTAANNRLADAESSDLGGSDLDRAASNFRDRWKYGIERIAKSTGAMVTGLEATRDLYAVHEQLNAEALNTVNNCVPDPGTASTNTDANAGPDSGPPPMSNPIQGSSLNLGF